MQCIVPQDGKCVLVERPRPEPGPRELLVRIQFSALNRADTLQRKGSYPPPPGVTDVLGLEMLGEVVGAGSDLQLGFTVGQTVMALLPGGGYAQYVAVDERLVMPIPAGLSGDQAAAIPEVWLTSFQLLQLVGKLQPGDNVLIHAAGSGVGTAATQLAVGMGARVVAVAGTDSKLENAVKLGAAATVNYKSTPLFAEAVMAATEGRGVDLILDPVGGGEHMTQNCLSAAPEARWVVYGLMGGTSPSPELLKTILRKRLSITGTTLRMRPIEYKAKLVAEFVAHALPKFEAGEYKVQVDSVYQLAEADEAHRYMETNANLGKILLAVPHPN